MNQERIGDILDRLDVSETLKAAFHGDPDFAQAISYVATLAPDRYMSFIRIVNDLRYEMDQRVLKEVNDRFRLERGLKEYE